MTNTVSRGKKNFMKKYRKIVFRVILFEDEGFVDFSDNATLRPTTNVYEKLRISKILSQSI